MNTLLVFAFGAPLLMLPLVVIWLALPASRQCPFCGSETLPVRTTLSRLLGRWLVLRWCVRCDWEGLARARPPRRGRWRIETVRERADETRPSAPGGP